MNKIIETIRNILALPFRLTKLLILIALIPINIIDNILHGTLPEYIEKCKFAKNAIKSVITELMSGKDATFGTSYYYSYDNCDGLRTYKNDVTFYNGEVTKETTIEDEHCESESEERNFSGC